MAPSTRAAEGPPQRRCRRYRPFINGYVGPNDEPDPRGSPMKIKFHARASSRLDGGGLAVVTDPCTPGRPDFDPIDDPADVAGQS
jgi:hypothetical protein